MHILGTSDIHSSRDLCYRYMLRRNSPVLREVSHTHTNIQNSVKYILTGCNSNTCYVQQETNWYLCTHFVPQNSSCKTVRHCVTVTPTGRTVLPVSHNNVFNRPKCGTTQLLRLARVFLVRYAPSALKQNTVRERRRSPWKRHTRDLWYVCSKIWYQLQRIAGAGGSGECARALAAGGRTNARKHNVCLVWLAKPAAV